MVGKPIIEVDNVTCRFGQVEAVKDVSLAVEEATIFSRRPRSSGSWARTGPASRRCSG